IDANSLCSLERSEIWLSNATKFNDPYDSSLTIGSRELHDEDSIELHERFSTSFGIPLQTVEKVMKGNSIEEGLKGLLQLVPQLADRHEMQTFVIQKYIRETNELFEEYSTEISNLYQSKIFASCFSEDPASMLMWSHY